MNENLQPQPKVVAGGLAGAVTVLVVWGLKQFAGVDLPADAAAALTVIVSTVASYLTSNK